MPSIWRKLGDNMHQPKSYRDLVDQGVLEVVEDDVGGTFRAVYTVKFPEAVFVLHCFQKKSKRGISTPLQDIEIIRARLKLAQAYVKELRK